MAPECCYWRPNEFQLSIGDSMHELRRQRMHGHQCAARFLVGRDRRCWRRAVKRVMECWWLAVAGRWCSPARRLTNRVLVDEETRFVLDSLQLVASPTDFWMSVAAIVGWGYQAGLANWQQKFCQNCVYQSPRRHLDSFKASWRQYFFARHTRHDSARSWLLRLLELRLTNFPTYLLTSC